ncbi:MAG: YkgJ family cysteine cluster protein [Candidatus Methanoperedens sp.]|nr:YkgJ family cysteine cluster protein [Candidatus Methanoperedens sp.]
MSRKTEIALLLKALDKALKIDEKQLADEIGSIGFKCKKCARCCRAEYGDNTVFIFPFEIRRICEKTGLGREDFVIPAPSEDRDSQGNIHTFEWVLRKNGDCIFLKGGLCGIYELRPYICKTYPFYLLDGRLMISECEGIGGDITEEDSRKLASVLKERYIAEIKEAIALFEKFEGFNPSGKGICVHDSEGEHWV